MDTSPSQSRQHLHLTPPSEQQQINDFFHRVYILSCAHCDTFISDRGMRAVLLLRPHISLHSTDGLPFNCGPIYTDTNGELEQVERTCNCLTQSIGCYGCGNTIGYHIISPCSRCVDSVSKHRRAANGHRWVFHYGEVSYKERTYVLGEPGVHPTTPIEPSHRSVHGMGRLIRNSSSSGSEDGDLTDEHEIDLSKPDYGQTEHGITNEILYDSEVNLTTSNLNRTRYLRPKPINSRREISLKEGDPLYWHQLVSAGERAGPSVPQPVPMTSRPAR